MKVVDNRLLDMHLYRMSHCDMSAAPPEPTDHQVEAAAQAWMTWQFPGREWDDAVPEMKNKFRDGARRALLAAAVVAIDPG